MVPEEETNITSSMTDIAYMINCKTLPYDHAFELSNQITKILPWLNDNLQNGMHMLHGPHAGHGWERSTDEIIFLSKRIRLILRIPKTYIDHAKKLEGVELKILGNTLSVGQSFEKPFLAAKDLFSKFVIADVQISEEQFLEDIMNELEEYGVNAEKAICGKTNTFTINGKHKSTRSLMIPGLSKKHSLVLQDKGIGKGRIFGCGLFLPHKSTDAVENFKEE